MLRYLWGGMMLLAVGYGIVTGRAAEVTERLVDSGQNAVIMTLSTMGLMAFWTGMMAIAKEGGLLTRLEEAIQPLLRRLFPSVPPDHPAMTEMAVNLAANFFGLGAAATPAGLRAMEQLETFNPHPGRATKAMCMFLIINMSSVQLMSMNIIAYRAQAGSASPTEIVLPTLLATTCSTVAGVLYARWKEGREQD
ncbi:MAG TPA: nucleoside recognition protein [Firmicutes bacterium]|nr:nucleoside recognition protein [Bacillota bacterium]